MSKDFDLTQEQLKRAQEQFIEKLKTLEKKYEMMAEPKKEDFRGEIMELRLEIADLRTENQELRKTVALFKETIKILLGM